MQEQKVREKTVPVTVAIPTFGRDEVLVRTVKYLLELPLPPAEILVLDQTPAHTPYVAKTLAKWENEEKLRHLKISRPSIPGSMNLGLLEAGHEIVLFVDDDIVPEAELLQAHMAAHNNSDADLIAGRVIQPWQEGMDFKNDHNLNWASLESRPVSNFIGCNFSVQRAKAIALGGFDENFVRVAYQYEAEFAYRWVRAGEKIYFEPKACIHHLKEEKGGTREYGEHLMTFKPNHAVGEYYYILCTWHGWKSFFKFLHRPLRAIATRHHLRRPWWIPMTLIAEISGIFWAFALRLRGPRYISLWNNLSRANK